MHPSTETSNSKVTRNGTNSKQAREMVLRLVVLTGYNFRHPYFIQFDYVV